MAASRGLSLAILNSEFSKRSSVFFISSRVIVPLINHLLLSCMQTLSQLLIRDLVTMRPTRISENIPIISTAVTSRPTCNAYNNSVCGTLSSLIS